MQKRVLLPPAAAIALWAVSPLAAAEGQFHTPSVRQIVPYPTGGGADFLARSIAQGMAEAPGQPAGVEHSAAAQSTTGMKRAGRPHLGSGPAFLGLLAAQFSALVQAPTEPWSNAIRTNATHLE